MAVRPDSRYGGPRGFGSGYADPEYSEYVSWAATTTLAPSKDRDFNGLSCPSEELLSCSDLGDPASGGPTSCNASFAAPLLSVEPADKEPATGSIYFSNGSRSDFQVDWDLRLFHHRTVCVVSVRHHRLLRCDADGRLTTDTTLGEETQWVVTSADGGGASWFRSHPHGLYLKCGAAGELLAVQDPSSALQWQAADAGSGNLFLHSGDKVLQCTPEGDLKTSPNRRSWEIWRLLQDVDHENLVRDLRQPNEPVWAVSTLLPLLRSYFLTFSSSPHDANPLSVAKAMTLALAYFLALKCDWRVALPAEVLKQLAAWKETARSPIVLDEPEDRLSVLSWLETTFVFYVPGGCMYVVDLDFKHKFEVLRKTPGYAEVYRGIPSVFLGSLISITKEVTHLAESLSANFRHFGMSLPWWRTAATLVSMYESCAAADTAKTKECLGVLTPFMALSPLNPQDGVHHLAWTLKEFLGREADLRSSPAGALCTVNRHAASRPLAPAEEDWEFAKEEPARAANGSLGGVDSPAPLGLLTEHFRPKRPSGPHTLLGRTARALDQVAFHHVLRHVAAHSDLADLGTSPP